MTDHDEQRVRTAAGWIGVEISRSRVRTPGKAGYGLYRVRGLALPTYPTSIGQDPMVPVPTEWTAYAFTLGEILTGVQRAISRGLPSGPGDLELQPAWDSGNTAAQTVPTRWTQAYRGKRNLGERRDPDAVGAVLERSTVRTRQRAANNEFQAEHLKRRAYGLERRHAAKLRRNESGRNGAGT